MNIFIVIALILIPLQAVAIQKEEMNLLVEVLKGEEKDINKVASFVQRHPWIAESLPVRFNSLVNINNFSADHYKFLGTLPYKTASNKVLMHLHNQGKEALKQIESIWGENILSEPLEQHLYANYVRNFNAQTIEKKLRILIVAKKKTLALQLVKAVIKSKQKIYSSLIQAIDEDVAARELIQSNAAPEVRSVAKMFHVKHLLKQKNDQEVQNILINMQYKEFPVEWWKIKHIAIRNALRDKQYQTALTLAQNNHGISGSDLFDAEWIAGFILFRLMDNPSAALQHFHKIYYVAKTSHSKAQGAYWLGRAHAALNHQLESEEWYKKAASYSHYFYGQLAIMELPEQSTNHARYNGGAAKITNSQLHERLGVAKYLYMHHLKSDANQILKDIADKGIAVEDLIAIEKQYFSQSETPLLVAFAKYLGNCGYPLIQASYPHNTDFSNRECEHNKSFYLAIMRQESGFDHEALSSAGARGLMQLMPGTAERYAKMMGLKQSINYCSQAQNIAIGTYYLDHLMQLWGKNYIMTIASYNAGENAVKRWILEYGDPRSLNTLHQTLDWIELIPYSETRLYVKKIIENMVNYEMVTFRNQALFQNMLNAFSVEKL